MIKRILWVIVLTFLGMAKTLACDVCGCSLSSLYFGYVSMNDRHFIGLKYSAASFKAHIDNDDFYFEDEYSHDAYHRIDLTGKFRLNPKFEVRYMLPFISNHMDGSHQNVRSSGMGDPMVLAYYTVFNTSLNIEGINHSLVLGGGLKLPFGEFEKVDGGEIINRNFQLGSGSFDYVLSANYMRRLAKYGINLESSFKMNTANKLDYRFGNQTNLALNIYRYLETVKVSVLPFVGAFFEYGEYHYSHGIRESNTGGQAVLATVGVQVFRGRFTLNTQYQIPVSQSFNTDSFATIKGGNRFSIGTYFSL